MDSLQKLGLKTPPGSRRALLEYLEGKETSNQSPLLKDEHPSVSKTYIHKKVHDSDLAGVPPYRSNVLKDMHRKKNKNKKIRCKLASFSSYFSHPENAVFWAPQIYGMLKGISATNKAKGLMLESSDTPYNKKLLGEAKGVSIIDTNKKVNAWVDRNVKSKWKRSILKKQMKSTLKEKDNAYALLPEEGTDTAVVVPKGLNPRIMEHEIGHIIDAKTLGKATAAEFGKMYSPFKSQLMATIMSPKRTPQYKAEQRAWEYGQVPEDDPIRRAALGSYEQNLKAFRYPILGALGAIGIRSLQRKGKVPATLWDTLKWLK